MNSNCGSIALENGGHSKEGGMPLISNQPQPKQIKKKKKKRLKYPSMGSGYLVVLITYHDFFFSF
jgi:hypothetical protein